MGRDVIDFNHDDDSVTNTGQAIAAINVAAFGDVATFKKNVEDPDPQTAGGCRASIGFMCRANAALRQGQKRTRDEHPDRSRH